MKVLPISRDFFESLYSSHTHTQREYVYSECEVMSVDAMTTADRVDC